MRAKAHVSGQTRTGVFGNARRKFKDCGGASNLRTRVGGRGSYLPSPSTLDAAGHDPVVLISCLIFSRAHSTSHSYPSCSSRRPRRRRSQSGGVVFLPVFVDAFLTSSFFTLPSLLLYSAVVINVLPAFKTRFAEVRVLYCCLDLTRSFLFQTRSLNVRVHALFSQVA